MPCWVAPSSRSETPPACHGAWRRFFWGRREDGNAMPVYGPKPLSFESLTVSTAALGLTVPAAAEIAYLTCETNDCKYRFDGADPTSTIGHRLVTGQVLEMRGRA